jgi:hypothetical protein
MEGTGAVELGGRTWAAVWRIPFPHEGVWQTMLEQVAAQDETDG